MRSHSPSSKRTKLEIETLLPTHKDLEEVDIPQLQEPEQEDSEDSCSICLHSIADRTVIPKCSHEFCFECLLVWTEQSRRCPLCSQAIGEYLIHSIRSRYDYRKHYLTPLRTSPPPPHLTRTNSVLQTTRQRRRREREWGTRARESDEADKLERSIARRRWIYRHDLYAKHVASNAYTKYRPYPTPAQFSASQDLISRTITFLRRELQIWEGLDVEFLTSLIISLMKSIDIRSESAVKLISEFLDMDAPYTPGGRHVNAEHFAHEVYSYVRSPYKDLFVYDTVAQYDTPSNLPQPTDIERSRRWCEPSPVWVPKESSADGRYSQKRLRSRSSERSTSWSPSGRRYSPKRETSGSGHRKVSMSGRTSPRPSRNIPKSLDKRRQNADSGQIGVQNNLGDEPQAPMAPSSNECEKGMPIFEMERDVKGKRKADEIGMTTSLTDRPSSDILELNLVHFPVLSEKGNELDERTRNMKPTRVFKVPRNRNRTLLDSVKAHLGVPEENAQNRADLTSPQASSSILSPRGDPVPSLLTRMSDSPYVPTVNSTKARNISGNCQENAGDNDKQSSHLDIDADSAGRQQLRRLPQLPCSQDSGLNCPTTAETEKPASSKNSHVVVHKVRPPPIVSRNSTATVEDDAMAIPSYQRIPSRSPVPSRSEENDSPRNHFHDQQIPHVQPRLSSIDAVEAAELNVPNQLTISSYPADARKKLLARLETEKRQVIGSSTDNNYSPQPLNGKLFSSSNNHSYDRNTPLNPHEREPDLLDTGSDSLVSEESRKSESKLRARAQLRVRLAAEKRLVGR